ncbi:hypothetical protein CC86DRAFT_283505 [Ophiobolus disseminans]|uniref:DUF3176 domain containing protein n=1 Tax=Ophiobolus disseminans TaxID=1469910 RepID=A0A6A7ABG5_9PLEO|nr:hypothetical protein CC86DRAFT_283505 [Ophiobolus disseminans]
MYCEALGEPTQEKNSLDFTQRIERKLAEYDASQSALKRWLFEIVSWCMSLVCMVAVVGIYVYLKGQPISASKSGILLTTANVLGKIASAALIVPTSEALGQLKWNWFNSAKAMWDFEIFDKATRGPWGAAMLLFRTRGRSLAALGALLVILLLAIDTFFQQVVELPERWSREEVSSKIPRTEWYNPGVEKEFRGGFPIASNNPDLFHIVEKFSYGNGTQPIQVGNGSQPEIPLTCPTSKCTWPVYETLGVCSQCADISSYLTYACLTSKIDWLSSLPGGFTAEEKYPNGTMCGYFLNSTSEHPVLMSGRLMDANESTPAESLLMRTLPLTHLTTREPLYGNGSVLFKHMRNTIVDVLIVSAVNASMETVHRRIPPAAQECVLYWCVKTIKSTYDFGKYEENISETHFNSTAGPFPWLAFPYVDEMGSGTDIFYMQDIVVDGRTSDGRNISGYGTSNTTAYKVIQSFIDIFPSFATTTAATIDPTLRYKLSREGLAYNRQLRFNPWISPYIVPRHLERLAIAMTNVIRSAPGHTMLQGDAFSRETYVAIHWEWLAFPFLLLILSLVFLVLTIVKTSGDGSLGIWKTSAMPALIYSLPPDETQGQFTSSATWSSGKGAPKKTRIKLLPNMGWRVSGQSHLSRSPRLPSGERVPRGWI